MLQVDGDDDDDAGAINLAPTDFLVMPENWDSVQVFSALSRCWRVDSFNGHYLGLERSAIESTLRLMGVLPGLHRGIFEDLRIMENAALEVLNK